MRAFVAILLVFLCTPCGASQARSYAILSLIGDRLLVAGPKAIAGQAPNPTFIELDDPALDAAVLRTVKSAVAGIEPGAQTSLLLARSPALFTAQREVLARSGEPRELVEILKARLGKVPGTHLILVSKLRHEPRMRFADNYFEGSGRLEGAGFYIDRAKRIYRTTDGQVAYGYLGLFAYLRVTLVDLATWSVVRSEEVLASTTHRELDKDPWDSLSAEEKVRILRGLIEAEVATAVNRVLSIR
jgi:hypothetical protein